MYKFTRLCYGSLHNLAPCDFLKNCDICISYGLGDGCNELYGLPMGDTGIGCKRDGIIIKPLTKAELAELYDNSEIKNTVSFRELFDFFEKLGFIKENLISFPSADYIDTVKESKHIRYVYYGTKEKYSGTIFTVLKNNTISDNSEFYDSKNIEQTVDYLESDFGIILFWVIWILITGAAVFGFYYLDNEWLE